MELDCWRGLTFAWPGWGMNVILLDVEAGIYVPDRLLKYKLVSLHHHLIKLCWICTLIKKKIKFSSYICKEIQSGAVTKSYMTNGLLIFGEIFAHFLIY
jgi:hypothetical protein